MQEARMKNFQVPYLEMAKTELKLMSNMKKKLWQKIPIPVLFCFLLFVTGTQRGRECKICL